MEQRHIMRLYLGQEMLRFLSYEGATFRCIRGIPADAHFLGAYEDHPRQGIAIYFEHPSFPLVAMGAEFPATPVVYEVIEHPLQQEYDAFPTRMGGGEWEYAETEKGKQRRGEWK